MTLSKKDKREMTANLPANPFGSGAIALNNAEAMANALAGAASKGQLGAAPEGSQYINFSGKRGVYEFGTDKEDISSDEIWLVNVAAFEDGFVCWKGGTVAATRMSNIYNGQPVPVPATDELGPFDHNKGEGWFPAKSMIVRSVEEDDRQGYFKINSKSGVSTFADLQNQVAERLRAARPFWPLIQFGKEQFTAKGFKNSKPTIAVYGWLSQEAVAELAENPEADIDDLIAMSETPEPKAVSKRRRGAL
jgi:hypothetical protein